MDVIGRRNIPGYCDLCIDGTPCAVKAARTVWVGGKDRDNIKVLPIDIVRTRRRRRPRG